MWRRDIALLLLVLGACSPSPEPSASFEEPVVLGSFEGEMDEVAGTFTIHQAGPSAGIPNASEALVPIPEGSGSPGYVTIENVAGTVNLNKADGCSAGNNSTEARVRITHHYPAGYYLRNVYAEITSIGGTGHAGCNGATTYPAGLDATKGLWSYTGIDPLSFADQTWEISRGGSTANYRFTGRVMGEVVTQTVPTSTNIAITNPTAIAYDGTNLWVAGAAATSKLYAFSPSLVQISGSPFAMPNNTATLLPTAAVNNGSSNAIFVTSADPTAHGALFEKYSTGGALRRSAPYAGAEFVAVSNDSARNNIFIADRYGNRVYVYDAPNSNEQAILTTASPYNIGTAPAALAFDGANTWVANSGSNDLTVIVTSGTGSQTFAGTKVATGARPVALAYDGANYVWAANQAAFTVTRHSKSAPYTGTAFAVDNQPDDLAIDTSGNVWVLSKAARVLTKLNSSGVAQGSWALSFLPTKIRFYAGFLWIGDAGGSVLVKWTGA